MAQAIAWYGKLPSSGDFVGRGLPRPLQRTWDDWLQRAMAAAQRRVGAALLRERLLAMAPWQCVVLAAAPGQPAWHGVVRSSADRVGRVFPLLLAEACDAPRLDALALPTLRARALQLARWLGDTAPRASAREFEAGAAQWAATAWPDAVEDGGETLQALRTRHATAHSFWWRLGPGDGAADPHAQPWPPQEGLLLEWLAVTD